MTGGNRHRTSRLVHSAMPTEDRLVETSVKISRLSRPAPAASAVKTCNCADIVERESIELAGATIGKHAGRARVSLRCNIPLQASCSTQCAVRNVPMRNNARETSQVRFHNHIRTLMHPGMPERLIVGLVCKWFDSAIRTAQKRTTVATQPQHYALALTSCS